MKIAIIGAGICGLYLAWKLAKKGEAVTVFEKREKIGGKICSGLFSERILEFIPGSQRLIENEIESALIHFPRQTLKINFSQKFFVISRHRLDNLVADLAAKAGAKIILNCCQLDSETNRLELKKEFERIIGCDGAISSVRKSLNLSDPEFRLGIQGFVQEVHQKNYVEAWPTENGFIWKIPRQKEVEYGIIEKPTRAKKLFEEFLKKNNFKLTAVNSATIPQGLVIPKNPKVTLCGNAAGLTKPWSGGGVVWGLMTADLLLKNFPDFLEYKRAVENFFSAPILFSKIAVRLVYFLGFKMAWLLPLLPKKFKIEGDFLLKKWL